MPATIEITPQTKINALVEAMPIAADVLSRFGLHCGGCGVNKYETIEQGVNAHGLRMEPVISALKQARLSGRVPQISHEDTIPLRRAPGEFTRRAKIKHVIPIMSGKGGVGKSLTTSLLSVALRRKNYHVGILDADITGPSIPRFFGLTKPLGLQEDPTAPPPAPGQQPRALMVPAVTQTAIQVVSSNLLTDKEDQAMVWRGPIVAGVIRQFYEQAIWNDLDYLLVDLPPGTSDAPLTVLQSLRVDGV
ncbi:MAG: P-loop NTPase, partial [bacterium]|nr:P-loop NTPase [bacterium]